MFGNNNLWAKINKQSEKVYATSFDVRDVGCTVRSLSKHKN